MFFGLAMSLNFSISFLHNDDIHQDFFTFYRRNGSVHLFRYNNTIYLQFYESSNLTIYEIETGSKIWRFTWPNVINEEEMFLVSGAPIIPTNPYDSLAFFDPVLDDDICKMDAHYGYLYGYLAFIAPLIFIVAKNLAALKREFNNRHVTFESEV